MIIKRLFLHGEIENYIVSFNEGLNIIYGDSDKGKTTILELIKYFLGGDEIQIGEEIKSKVKRCFLEIETSDSLLTIERNIFNKNDLIKVCKEKVENILMGNIKTYKFYTLDESSEFERFSDFLLNTLGYPIGKIRKGAGKNSQLQTITFRSIFKYCYLTQDDIGSKKILNFDNPILSAINAQILRYIYKILDMDIEELEGERQKIVALKNSKELEYNMVSNFLQEIGIEDLEIIENEVKKLEADLSINIIKKKEIDNEILKNTELLKELREKLRTEYIIEKKIKNNLESLKIEQEEFYLLLDEYKKELEKIEIGIKLGASLKYTPEFSTECKCPLCNKTLEIKEIEEKFEIESTEFLMAERKRIKLKYRNVETYIRNGNLKIDEYTKEKIKTEETIRELENILNNKSEEFISPYISTRDFFIETLGKIKEKVN
ncbi:MAG: hypothetical protein ACRDDH_03770, partial [Cetobacterium sp.]|uniref:hypothetical protein n=1 Tax=Cetobacterium sp. TaxID=2071632 RepID=UPI003EE770F4